VKKPPQRNRRRSVKKLEADGDWKADVEGERDDSDYRPRRRGSRRSCP